VSLGALSQWADGCEALPWLGGGGLLRRASRARCLPPPPSACLPRRVAPSLPLSPLPRASLPPPPPLEVPRVACRSRGHPTRIARAHAPRLPPPVRGGGQSAFSHASCNLVGHGNHAPPPMRAARRESTAWRRRRSAGLGGPASSLRVTSGGPPLSSLTWPLLSLRPCGGGRERGGSFRPCAQARPGASGSLQPPVRTHGF
jgi:hypothetical protein